MMQPQTAADMLGKTGEVFIQKSQQGGGSPMIRDLLQIGCCILLMVFGRTQPFSVEGTFPNVISAWTHML